MSNENGGLSDYQQSLLYINEIITELIEVRKELIEGPESTGFFAAVVMAPNISDQLQTFLEDASPGLWQFTIELMIHMEKEKEETNGRQLELQGLGPTGTTDECRSTDQWYH